MNCRQTMNDDPREVLALLNSLGFVGITAPQLKAFMKDLKLYRKIKDREKQQRKEELKKKIIIKQESMIKEILRDQYKEANTISSDSTNFYPDDSLIKVRVRCTSEDDSPDLRTMNLRDKSNKENVQVIQKKAKEKTLPSAIKSDTLKRNEGTAKHCPVERLKTESKSVDTLTKRLDRHRIDGEYITNQEKPVFSNSACSKSEVILRNKVQDREWSQTRSASSTWPSTRSGSKSFIRPWRLQPDARKSMTCKKSDPVALYQKYQQDWKQMSFPGEAKHAGIRWAVRERMLGADPHPLPLQRRSTSMAKLRGK